MSDPDRWKCPDCARIYVDPATVISGCACGSNRIQLRHWPNGPEGWEAPEWPADTDYSPDAFDVEGELVHNESRWSR